MFCSFWPICFFFHSTCYDVVILWQDRCLEIQIYNFFSSSLRNAWNIFGAIWFLLHSTWTHIFHTNLYKMYIKSAMNILNYSMPISIVIIVNIDHNSFLAKQKVFFFGFLCREYWCFDVNILARILLPLTKMLLFCVNVVVFDANINVLCHILTQTWN